MFDGLIVSGLREMVESDGQCVGGQVGCEIRLGLEDLAQQGAGIVTTARLAGAIHSLKYDGKAFPVEPAERVRVVVRVTPARVAGHAA